MLTVKETVIYPYKVQAAAAIPPPSGPAWKGNSAAGSSLAQIQSEELKTQLQLQKAPGQVSSYQLKSLLGLSISSSNLNAGTESKVWEAPVVGVTLTSSSGPPANSLKEILRQEQAKQKEENELKQQQSQLLMQQQVRAARESAAAESATAAVISAASWSRDKGGHAAAQAEKGPKSAPSLRDIMQLEEASSAASQLQASSSDSPFASAPRPAPGSWAAKASSTSGGSMIAIAAKQTHSVIPNSSANSGNGTKKSAASAVAPPTPPPTQLKSSAIAGPSFTGSQAGFPADLSEWCVTQLAKIRAADSSSSADPTEFFGVLEYCATLQSAVEVRETFSAYLGSSALVISSLSVFSF